jgi:hypothetical protein
MVFFCALCLLLSAWPLVEESFTRPWAEDSGAGGREEKGRVVVGDCRLAVTFIYLVNVREGGIG